MSSLDSEPPEPASADSLAHLATLLAGEEPNEVREGLLVDFSLVASLAVVRAITTLHPQGSGFAAELIQQWRERVQQRMGRAFVTARTLDSTMLGRMMLDQAEQAFQAELTGVEEILRLALLSRPPDPPPAE